MFTSLPDRIADLPRRGVALRRGPRTLSYGELNRRSGSLARDLQVLGVDRGSSVAICLERSFEQITAALAAMRAGAAYVPIDPAWPDERIRHVLSDSGAAAFIAPRDLLTRISSSAIPLDLEEPAAVSPLLSAGLELEAAAEHGSRPLAPGDLAYIIYTSGSTGVPKGVEITHANLNHLISWHLEAFAVTSADRASHLAGLGFDAAVWEVWPYLAAGASVFLVDDDRRADPALLLQWIVDCGIDISFVPTPLAQAMIAMEWPDNTRLRTLLTGGDTLHTAPRTGLPFTVVNNYGPTECTVVATSGLVEPDSPGLPSIGKPISGTKIYLLNSLKAPVPPGERGEIFIAGGGVGRGYRNRPDLTAESFLPDPFDLDSKGCMYKTGDLASLLPDGRIAFHGRSDTQVKIRGYRIELDEIGSVLNRHPAIVSSVVAVSPESNGDKHLIAYLLPIEGASPAAQEMREFAQNLLPDYMIPSVFVQISALPLSANGKIDRSLLPAPSPENMLRESPSRETLTEVEAILLSLVQTVLGVGQVGVEDDFFLLGGHSLLGTQLVLRVRETFGVMLTLRDIFEAATVAKLAARVEDLLLDEVSGMSEEEARRLASEDRA